MNKVVKTTVVLMVATIISKILGFGRELVLASAYGVSAYSDAYITAMNIPAGIFSAVGVALATTLIPIHYDIEKKLGEDESIKFINNVFNTVLIITMTIAILGYIFAEPLVMLFASGFKGETFKITVDFTRILILGVIFMGISNLMSAFLQIKNNFIVPGLIGLPFNIIIILSILLSKELNPYILAYGTLIAMGSQILFQLPFAIKKGYKYKCILNAKDKYLKHMIGLLCPICIGVAVNQVNAIVDRTLASGLIEGSISALNYANKLNTFVIVLFITSIASVIYPLLSRLNTENNREEFVEIITKSVNSVILFVIPISVGAIVLSNPIIKILFERGEFDENATKMTAIALIFYAIGMIGFGLRDILGRVFYSLQDTKTPMINGVIAMILNIVLNLMVIKYMKHAGLAFATSISSITCIFLLFGSLKKKIGYFGQDKILKTTFKSIIAAVVMGIVTYFTYDILISVLGSGFTMEAISLFGSIGIGAIVYGALVVILRVEEVNVIVDIIKSKLNKKKDCKETLSN